MSSLEVLERIAEFDPVIAVILMTAHYTSKTALEAIRKRRFRLSDQAGFDHVATRANRETDRGSAPVAARYRTPQAFPGVPERKNSVSSIARTRCGETQCSLLPIYTRLPKLNVAGSTPSPAPSNQYKLSGFDGLHR